MLQTATYHKKDMQPTLAQQPVRSEPAARSNSFYCVVHPGLPMLTLYALYVLLMVHACICSNYIVCYQTMHDTLLEARADGHRLRCCQRDMLSIRSTPWSPQAHYPRENLDMTSTVNSVCAIIQKPWTIGALLWLCCTNCSTWQSLISNLEYLSPNRLSNCQGLTSAGPRATEQGLAVKEVNAEMRPTVAAGWA